MNTIRVLLWKEWREQRPALCVLAILTLCLTLTARIAGPSQAAAVGPLCALIASLLLGAAVVSGEHSADTLTFLHRVAIPLRRVWLVKCSFGLAFSAAAVVLAQGVTGLDPLALRFRGPSTPAILCCGWLCFALSHYFACWVRSPISAVGLGALLGACLLGLTAFNPVAMYASQALWAAGFVVVWVEHLAWAGKWFVGSAMHGAGVGWRRALLRFLMPLVLFGVAPLLAGVAAVTIDHSRLDPSDISALSRINVAPDRGRLLFAVQPAYRFRPLRWTAGPSLVAISCTDGTAQRVLSHPLMLGHEQGPISPDSARIALTVRESRWQASRSRRIPRMAVFEPGSGTLHTLPLEIVRAEYAWLSRDRLAFFFWSPLWRCGWGTWTAVTRVCKTSRVPHQIGQYRRRFLGFLHGPDRVAFAHTPSASEVWRVTLFDFGTGETEHVLLPKGYYGAGVSADGRLALIKPDGSDMTVGEQGSPRLLEFASAKSVSLDARLGLATKIDWRTAEVSLSSDKRWLLVVPRVSPGKPRLGWYAVELIGSQVYRHAGPGPDADPIVSPNSARIASVLVIDHDRVLLVQRLRDTDPAQQFVITAEGRPARFWKLAWLSDVELVFCAEVFSYPVNTWRRLVRTEWSWPRAAVFIADLQAKRVRPLWPSDGLGTQWRITTWPEWERKHK